MTEYFRTQKKTLERFKLQDPKYKLYKQNLRRRYYLGLKLNNPEKYVILLIKNSLQNKLRKKTKEINLISKESNIEKMEILSKNMLVLIDQIELLKSKFKLCKKQNS